MRGIGEEEKWTKGGGAIEEMGETRWRKDRSGGSEKSGLSGIKDGAAVEDTK